MLPKASCLLFLAFRGFGIGGRPFFPLSVYIYVPPCHSPVPNHLFLEPHAADTSVVCCIHGWIP